MNEYLVVEMERGRPGSIYARHATKDAAVGTAKAAVERNPYRRFGVFARVGEYEAVHMVVVAK